MAKTQIKLSFVEWLQFLEKRKHIVKPPFNTWSKMGLLMLGAETLRKSQKYN